MNNETKKTARNYFHFDFDLVKKHLGKLGGNKERKKYLVAAKTEYGQTYLPIDYSRNDLFDYEKVPDFGMKCNYEIDKLNDEIQEESQNDSKDGNKRRPNGLTIDRAILLMLALAPRLKGHDQNKISVGIAFLTEFSEQSIRINLSEIKNKYLNKPKAYDDDKRIVCKILNSMGFIEEAETLKKSFGDK